MSDIPNGIQQHLSALPAEKANCIKLLMAWSDDYSLTAGEGIKTTWTFKFDDGAYKGHIEMKFQQSEITPLVVMGTAKSIGWPGLKAFYSKAIEAINETIKVELESKP